MGYFDFMYRQLSFKPSSVPSNIDLSGQTAVVTGANVGLGLEAAHEIIAHKISRIILGVRDISKGELAKEQLAEDHPKCNIEVWGLDHESFDSVCAFAERAKKLDRLDVVLLNAGVKKAEWSVSPTGHETTVQVNHLATALLSLLLLSPLKSTARTSGKPSHMTIVASEVHMWTPFNEVAAPNILARLDQKETFASPERYNTSKLLNVLWVRELASKVEGTEVIINAVNPGFCWSSLQRDSDSFILRLYMNVFAWSTAQGGHCLADAAIAKQGDTHGKYLSEQRLTLPSEFVRSTRGADAQSKLWAETVELLRTEVPQASLGPWD